MDRKRIEEQKGKVMTRQMVIFPMIIFALVTLFLAACNLPNNAPIPTTTPSPHIIESTATLVSSISTITLMPPTSAPTASPIPPTPVPPTPTTCNYNMRFVADVSIPDDTVILPSQGFVKTWRIANNGNCLWPTGSSWVFADGNQMGSTNTVPIPVTDPGSTVDVSVNLIAPNNPGTYTGYWTLRLPEGEILNQRFFVRIVVPAPSPTPQPIVIIMDGNNELIVYNPETFKAGGTNADDVAKILADLTVDIRKETTDPNWNENNEHQIHDQNPELIIIHASAFYPREDYGDKLIDFLQHMQDTRAKFLIYTRAEASRNEEDIKQSYEDAYPFLRGRLDLLRVPFPENTQDCRYWKCIETRERLIRKVKSLLALP